MKISENVSYKLQLPSDVYEQIKEIAASEGTTIAEVIRRAIKWEILAQSVYDSNGAIYVQRDADAQLVQVAPLTYQTKASS